MLINDSIKLFLRHKNVKKMMIINKKCYIQRKITEIAKKI